MSRPHRFLAALVSGALLALAFPDAGIGLLSLVALAPLIAAVLRSSGPLEAFFLGLAGSLVTWLVNVPWVIHVMVRYGGLSMPVGVSLYLLLSLVLAAYGGLFALLVRRMRAVHPTMFWFLAPAAWTAIELLRTYLLTGFSWNLLAVALIDETPLVMAARVIGPYGVGFLAMVPATILGWIAATEGKPKLKRTAAIAGAALVLAWWGSGALMLRSIAPRAGEPFRAVMLQPNISQEMRWEAGTTLELFGKMMRMTAEAGREGATTIVWPESTVPLTFVAHELYRESVAAASAELGADVILGSVAEDPDDPSRLWNAAYLVHRGELRGRYDKIHLVPFGEYVPLRKVLFFAEKLVRAVGEFQFGTNERPLEGWHRYGPAICYEIVFPQIPRRQVLNGADVLVTITNDGWFGGSGAPRQHLDAARLRAVETDRWLLRAATSGISALVDPAGRLVDSIPMNREGIIVGEPTARQSTTAYVRFGDWFAWLAALATAIAAARPQLGKVGNDG
ncbi:MAG TPA: apolipoprotein N-acyltransferase [Thermoanaerobaculia bacterium]|nr:apolipoprotein N-acyltransferase [Thermoanaerobaculia bacterium]